MRVLVVAMVALTSLSGVASALTWEEPVSLVKELAAPPALPPAPLVDAPQAPTTEEPLPLRALVATGGLSPSPSRVQALLETVTSLPTLLLLPDGALVIPQAALAGADAVRASDYVRLPPRIEAPVAAAPASTEAPAQAADAPAAAPLAPFAPAPTSARPQTAFAPSPVGRHASPAALVAGGLAIGAIGLLGLALYHRIRPHAALENETRKQIFDAVCDQPGLGVHEVARQAGVSYSTATYHLERLVAAGMLVMTPDGNKLCYYKNGGAFTESERRILPLVKNDEAARLFEAILESPGTYRAALAERLGVTATTINWHLRRLRDAGLVDETRAGRSAFLYARADAMRESFASLAAKLGERDPVVVERLRRYAERPTAAGA